MSTAFNYKKLFKSTISALGFVILASFASCSSDDDDNVKDLKKPIIESSDTALPQNCDVYYKGDVIPFRYTMTDDIELGNFNIEIHNNFDHHTHSTDAGNCELDPIKTAVKPWVFNQDYSIHEASTLYNASIDIPIPTDIDEGDYHFMIRLTDKSGWQQLKAVSVKIKNKE